MYVIPGESIYLYESVNVCVVDAPVARVIIFDAGELTIVEPGETRNCAGEQEAESLFLIVAVAVNVCPSMYVVDAGKIVTLGMLCTHEGLNCTETVAEFGLTAVVVTEISLKVSANTAFSESGLSRKSSAGSVVIIEPGVVSTSKVEEVLVDGFTSPM